MSSKKLLSTTGLLVVAALLLAINLLANQVINRHVWI